MLHKIFDHLGDVERQGSLANKMRQKRFAEFTRFRTLVADDSGERLTLLDVGGTSNYWEQMGTLDDANLAITTLNLEPQPDPDQRLTTEVGSALELPYADNRFDIVFSNSVIEHVGGKANRIQMAKEVERVASRGYFVQTPNRWFPIEPHFHRLACHPIMPESVRVRSLAKKPGFNAEIATQEIREIELMNKREVQELFPGARIAVERVFGLTKSFMALKSLR